MWHGTPESTESACLRGWFIVLIMEDTPPGIDFEETKRILTALEREGVRTFSSARWPRMKRDTVRPQDRLDAEVIKEEFKLKED